MVSADAAAFIESGGASQTAEGNGDDDALAPGSSAPFGPVDVLALDPEDHARPLPGYGVVVRGGEVVPALGVDEEMGDGPCDPVRKYKNFLTASLEPGAETFVVMGAVSHCAGSELSVPELTVPIKYRRAARRGTPLRSQIPSWNASDSPSSTSRDASSSTTCAIDSTPSFAITASTFASATRASAWTAR